MKTVCWAGSPFAAQHHQSTATRQSSASPHNTLFLPPAMAQATTKRQKMTHANRESEFFPGIGPVEYKPNAEPSETLVFRHYNAQQEVLGRTMEEWLRFSVCYWHSFRGTGSDPFGGPTIKRPWDDDTDSLDNAKRRLRAAFEFFTKLGIKYWTFHDRDLAPEGKTLAETNANLDEVVELAAELMNKTGVKLLWATCNLFVHPRQVCSRWPL
ncbi:Xylose isomerase [Portunus trituberculatus]|uniref:Xylose isomerase n=1 Tax=Portunus trituberculatus TaxID=210409 RepID=A0A5B7EAR3_PORTR|nr:Xylose isomerase [Portunus trituberculatus]